MHISKIVGISALFLLPLLSYAVTEASQSEQDKQSIDVSTQATPSPAEQQDSQTGEHVRRSELTTAMVSTM